MRGDDADGAAGARQAVELFHGADDIIHVLDDVKREHTVEGVIGERIGSAVQVAKNVGAAHRVPVDTDRTRLLVHTAADVQNSQFSRIAVFRHSSSTSTANPAWSRVMTSGGQSRIEFSPAPKTSSPRVNASSSTRLRISGARSRVC